MDNAPLYPHEKIEKFVDAALEYVDGDNISYNKFKLAKERLLAILRVCCLHFAKNKYRGLDFSVIPNKGKLVLGSEFAFSSEDVWVAIRLFEYCITHEEDIEDAMESSGELDSDWFLLKEMSLRLFPHDENFAGDARDFAFKMDDDFKFIPRLYAFFYGIEWEPQSLDEVSEEIDDEFDWEIKFIESLYELDDEIEDDDMQKEEVVSKSKVVSHEIEEINPDDEPPVDSLQWERKLQLQFKLFERSYLESNAYVLEGVSKLSFSEILYSSATVLDDYYARVGKYTEEDANKLLGNSRKRRLFDD